MCSAISKNALGAKLLVKYHFQKKIEHTEKLNHDTDVLLNINEIKKDLNCSQSD